MPSTAIPRRVRSSASFLSSTGVLEVGSEPLGQYLHASILICKLACYARGKLAGSRVISLSDSITPNRPIDQFRITRANLSVSSSLRILISQVGVLRTWQVACSRVESLSDSSTLSRPLINFASRALNRSVSSSASDSPFRKLGVLPLQLACSACGVTLITTPNSALINFATRGAKIEQFALEPA